jgi:hypothetical protein
MTFHSSLTASNLLMVIRRFTNEVSTLKLMVDHSFLTAWNSVMIIRRFSNEVSNSSLMAVSFENVSRP